ncbi:MAG: ATP-binding protein [Deltaproteobacteria bacterium]
MRAVFSNLSLKTKFLLMMVSLFSLLVVCLFILYAMAEQELIEEVRHQTEELSTAIQLSVEEISKSDEAVDIEKIKGVTSFKQKGIKELSVIDSSRDVIASSNASLIGKKLKLKGESFKTIGNVTEYTSTSDGQKRFDILLPVVVDRELLGYVHIATGFDDFADLARSNHLRRLTATIIIFAIGILLTLYFAKTYTEPIQEIADAARKVAAGDLTMQLKVRGRDEIGALTRNFNDMVRRLGENNALQEKLKEAEHMSKIGTLASGIAHEVRNPLNFINLSIDHLRVAYGPQDAAKREAFLASIAGIKSEIDRLNGMVSNFLDYGRQLTLNLKRIDLRPIIAETLVIVSDSASAQNVSIETIHNGQAVEVQADYRHLKTCFLNIFLNAIQAMPGGGQLTVSAVVNNGTACVMVSDTGCGIAPENLPKIFEPYFTTKDIGIGLGLALTRRIIEEHGGSLTIESEQGRGTDASIKLPAARQ